ncbi:MAG TPA: glycerol-3-phosphate 1-O-acyltransferase PlsY [Geobacterales bacterium]|nr:glycerol-3-phosphate 1-O-acyltransferase PlsY [Geobacterales bacterium]
MFLHLTITVAAYLLGSVPTGLLIARAKGGVDIRTAGSGNIGATNVYRTMGRTAGVITLMADAVKGFLPVFAAQMLDFPPIWIAAIGLAAFLGHVFTVFLRFKGGKGVATGLGVFLAASPLAVLSSLAIFIIVVLVWRYISLGSILAAAVTPIFILLFTHSGTLTLMGTVIAAIIIVKHHENIRRLVAGTESKFKA